MQSFQVRLERHIGNIQSTIVVNVRAENRDEAAFQAENELGTAWKTLQVLQ